MYDNIKLDRDKLVIAANQNIKQKEFWLAKLSGDFKKSRFPCDSIFKPGTVRRLTTETFRFPGELFSKLVELSNNVDVRLHMLLAAGLVILINKYSGENDVVLGTPIYKQEVEGRYINTVLVLRNRLEENISFKELLLQVRQNILDASKNQDYPLNLLAEQLNMEVEENDFPLFDIVIFFESLHEKSYIQGIDVNMTFAFSKKADYIDGEITYNSSLYRESTIKQISGHYLALLQAVLPDLDREISGIGFLSEEEKNRILYDFNRVHTGYPRAKTIQELFAGQVEKTPGHTAVVYDDVHLAYSELNKRSNQLARLLRNKGIGPDCIVGLCIHRSPEMMISIMAILKAGGAYLPIDPNYPGERVIAMLDDSSAPILLTRREIVERYSFVSLKGLEFVRRKPGLTAIRPQIKDLDNLPVLDRSLVSYEKYNRYIGLAAVKDSVCLQGTRGCPFKCVYCHKIWPKTHIVRSAENIFNEVRQLYDMGIKRFSFIDDIFNLNVKNSTRFFELLIKNNMDVQLFFPNGLRGELLSKDYIDMMIEAGTVNISLSLETASPRLQRLIKKNLNIEKLRENVRYLCEKHPRVILDVQTMHGFPTETEEEAMKTMEFLQGMKWVHFPYIHVVKIYPNTEMEQLALRHGISRQTIRRSADRAYHEWAETLPFDRNFTLKYQSEFLDEYFLSRERLLHVLPYQMKVMTEDEIVQKYNSYLGEQIDSFPGLLEFVGIKEEELEAEGFPGPDYMYVPGLDEKLWKHFPANIPDEGALKLLILDLTTFFSKDRDVFYNMIEPPLGPMYVLTYLNHRLGGKINGKIIKSRLDFDSYDQLKVLLDEFKPDVIGVRSLTYYKDFFHNTIEVIRQYGIDVPIITGGPYASSDYEFLLQDRNIDLAVMGEGEVTFCEVIEKIIENNGRLPDESVLREIPGIAYLPGKGDRSVSFAREILFWEEIQRRLPGESKDNLPVVGQSSNLAYNIFTSGSTGNPKGTLTTHYNVTRIVRDTNYIKLNEGDRVLQLSNYAFDGSVFDIYGALLNGSTLVMLKPGEVLLVDRLSHLIKKEGITVFFVTTALFNTLVRMGVNCLANVQKVLFGGEMVSMECTATALEHLGKSRVVHMYGPTETAVFATYHDIDELDEGLGTVPIGKPVANTSLFILDETMNCVPIGAVGEIYIGGEGTARGYLNKPELTAEKFFHLTLNTKHLTLYKTGDLGRWLADGSIEFLGRNDYQVKLRGFRVELEEIEKRLLEHCHIREAVVTIRKSEGGISAGSAGSFLCAYFAADELLVTPELKEYLSKKLPDYMVPSYFIQLERMPLTIGGKIDRGALPAPEAGGKQVGYTPPRDGIEEKLVETWSRVLGIEKEIIGIDDNFFERGGHSLNSTQLAAKIHKTFNIRIPLAEIFRLPSIRELAGYIKNNREEEYTPIKASEEKDYYLLSPAQKRLYILQQMGGVETAYNITAAVLLEGDLNIEKFADILRELHTRHESLRTSFEMINEEPVQIIRYDVEFKIEYCDSGTDIKIQNSFVRPFDVSKAPLVRVGLFKMEDRQHLLIMDMHHIIADGTSLGIFVKEFMEFYEGKTLPALRIQYEDFSQWQNNRMESGEMREQEIYWQQEFADEIPVLHLPYDYPRPGVQSFKGNSLLFAITQEDTAGLKWRAKEEGATLFMVLLAVYNVLLSKLSGQEDIIVGTPLAGRRHADLQPVMGMFVNTLALRSKPSGSKTWAVFLQELKQSTLKAFENQDYQFEKLVERASVNRDAGRNPLFDIMLTLQNVDIPPIEIPGLKLKPREQENKVSKFDLTLHAVEEDHRLVFRFEYCTELFKASTIERFISYFKTIISAVGENSEIRLSGIRILAEEEKQRLLFEFNDTRVNNGGGVTIHRLVEEQVEKTPDAAAVVYEGRHLTYRELNRKANQLAAILRDKGVKSEVIVSIMADRSVEMIIGMLAIMKSGAAYLPIDPEQPGSRIGYMLADSGVTLLLMLTRLQRKEQLDFHGEVIYLDQIDSYGSRAFAIPGLENHMAYVIYTSGSTGRPKGVIIQHRSIVNTLRWQKNYYSFNRDDWILQIPSYAFDSSVEDIFTPLISGSRLVLLQQANRYHLEYLKKVIKTNRITHFLITPGLYKAFLDEIPGELERMKSIIVAGDHFTGGLVKEHFGKLRGVRLYNEYGPTENSVCSTIYEFSPHETRILIGKPIDNVGCYILDRYRNLVPMGVAGELCLSGKGLARGYLNNPELTEERFFNNRSYRSNRTYSLNLSKKIYKTGDLARWLVNGTIEFLGRIDRQVKIRGYRIETGEIEDRLLKHEQVKEAVVVVKETFREVHEREDKEDKYLAAYIVGAGELSVSELREFLSRELPGYMIPPYFVLLDKIPLTPNGKIDRGALPEPEQKAGEEYIAPGNELEERLVEIWSELLGIEKESISMNANFFDLGGHSLKATVLVSRIHKELDVDIPLAEIFKTPTIRDLASLITAWEWVNEERVKVNAPTGNKSKNKEIIL